MIHIIQSNINGSILFVSKHILQSHQHDTTTTNLDSIFIIYILDIIPLNINNNVNTSINTDINTNDLLHEINLNSNEPSDYDEKEENNNYNSNSNGNSNRNKRNQRLMTPHHEINDYSKSNSEENEENEENDNNIENTNGIGDNKNNFRILVANPSFDEHLHEHMNLNVIPNSSINRQISSSILLGDLNCKIDGNCAQKPQDDGYISSYHYYQILQQNNNNKEKMI